MYKVVITDTMKPVTPEELVFKAHGIPLIYGDCKTENELIEFTQDADGIVSVLTPMTAKVINTLKKCQIIVRRGIGYDIVDTKAAAAKGIPVANVPDYCVEEVADHAMTLLLCAVRKVIPGREHVRDGHWLGDFKQLEPIPALKDCTLGLVGFGRIAREVAIRAKSFGMKVQATDPYIPDEVGAQHGVKLVSLDELITSSDFISIHAPLTDDTRDLISKREFAKMKPTAILINTARAAVVNEEALIEALQSGKIAVAAFDVMAQEPPKPDNPLLKMGNMIITPHTAWYSDRASRVLGEKVAEEILRVFKGYLPKNLVNPDVIKVRPDLKKPD